MPSFRGYPACACLIEWLPVFEAELKRRGVIKVSIDIAQLIGSAPQSAATHKPGGAFDIWQHDATTVKVAREMGAAAWARTRAQGFDPHTHGVLNGCPHNSGGRYQIAALKAGRNGLGWMGLKGKDDGPAPRSLRTYKAGIAWAKTQGKPTPKPIPTVDPTPQPVAHKDWGKVEVVNHGAATVALKKPGAYAKWLTRRTRLVNITMGKGGIKPDILVGLECGGGSAFTYLTKKYAKGGLVRTKAGTDGREIFIRPSAVTVRETGAIRPTPHKGNDKPAPWIVGTLDGSPIMVVGFHLDPTDPSSEVPLGQAKEIIAAARKIAARYKVPESNLIFLGDAASDDYVRRSAFAAAGWLDAFAVAKKKVNAAIASYNRYKAPVVGPSVDGIFVHSTRPVRVASKRLDSKASDHHVLAAVLSRQ
jgi:hypothetical protein